MAIRRFAYRLSVERDRLDDTLGELERHLRAGDHDAARRRLSRFIERFDRYVQSEERLLFPVLEEGAPARQGPTIEMRREHGFLRMLVAALRDALRRADHARSLDAVSALRSVFFVHHAKEEWVIHPLLASAVEPATEDAVVRLLLEP